MTGNDVSVHPLTRQSFLKRAGAAGMTLLGGTLWRTAPAAARARRVAKVRTPIEHLVIACQENRSFDHYYGYAPQVQAKGFGPPAGYFQPDSAGGKHFPFEFTSLTTPDPPHGWNAVHRQYDGGKMDGFWQSSQDSIGDGDAAIGYYTARELPFYYSLFDNSALCANYFCSLLGPTWPNRFYFAAGTSGGITTNGVWGYGVFDYPIILDLLDAAGVTWGVYNMNWDSVPFGNTDNVFVFWKNFAHDQRTLGSKGSFLNDARAGRLPQVSWLISSFAHEKDEHPPADAQVTEPRLRLVDPDGVELPGERRAGAAARRTHRHQRPARPVRVLAARSSSVRPIAGSGPWTGDLPRGSIPAASTVGSNKPCGRSGQALRA